ncbi:MAG: hypothetical protein WD995_07580 [Gemmatimonadota bacterium]
MNVDRSVRRADRDHGPHRTAREQPRLEEGLDVDPMDWKIIAMNAVKTPPPRAMST